MRAETFLVTVSDDSESEYGYASKGATYTLSAVGLLSRIYIGDKSRTRNVTRDFVKRGMEKLWDEHKPCPKLWEIYYLYYATQTFHFAGGKDWDEKWNPAIRKLLLEKQITENAKTAKATDIGSFSKDTGFIGTCCGKVGSTAMALLMLEVYYRNPSLQK